MNRKLILGAVAGVAAIGLAVGGTTYAAYSDFGTISGNTVGAGVLKLTVDPSASQKFDKVTLMPGGTRDYAFFVASRQGAVDTNATLTMTLKDLVGTEDGCDTNSEVYAETNGASSDPADPSAPCNAGKDTVPTDANYDPGQFISQAMLYVQSYTAPSGAACTTGAPPMQQRLANTVLTQAENHPIDLLGTGNSLPSGSGVCVLAQIFMPGSGQGPSDNTSQGDSAAFDLRFDLAQAIS